MNNQSDFLEDLTIEQLKELLVSTYSPEEDPKQEVFAERIMEVILRKEAESPTGFFMDTETAWSELVDVYLPKTKEDEEFVVHFLEDSNDNFKTDATDSFEVPKIIPNKTKRRFLSSAAAIAAIILLLNAFTITAYGLNLIQVVAKWGEDVFYHESVSNIPANSLAKVLETVEGEFDTSFNFFPSWLPEDLELVETYTQGTSGYVMLIINFSNDSDTKHLSINVAQYGETRQNILYQEKDIGTDGVSTLIQNDITHYIFENQGMVTATWALDRFECMIVGNISISEMEKCIASIYEGVD